MQGTISFDGTLSGGISGGGGGGSEVTITPVLTEGTKIADYSIDSESGSLYAPTPEELPDTIVTKALRKYNDDTQTKIMTITTLDTENSQEVSQDIYAPSPVQCWYTPGLEQDYEIGKFTYGGVTQNVYIPNFQRPLTAGANITIDVDNVISASVSSLNINNTPTIIGKWDTDDLYCVKYTITPSTSGDYVLDNNFGSDKTLRLYDVSMCGLPNQMAKFSSSIDDTLYVDSGKLKYYINKVGAWWSALNTLDIIVLYT